MISGEESLWAALKFQGFFSQYDTYEDYQNRNKVVKTKADIIKEDKIKENIRKSEEIELLIANYKPKSTDPKKLKKFDGLILEKTKEELDQEKKEALELEEKNYREHLKFLRTKLKTKHDWEMYEGISGGVLDQQELKIKEESLNLT